MRRRTTISTPPPPVATHPMTTPRPSRQPPAGRFFPSSIGLSLLVSKQTRQLRLEVNWGDYRAEPLDAPVDDEESPAPEISGRMPLRWRREPHRVEMTLNLATETAKAVEHEVPDSDGLRVAVSVRPVQALGIAEGMVPDGTRSVSVFLVNHRIPGSDELRDERFIRMKGSWNGRQEAHQPQPPPCLAWDRSDALRPSPSRGWPCGRRTTCPCRPEP